MVGVLGGDVDLNWEVARDPRISYVEQYGDYDQFCSRNTIKLY